MKNIATLTGIALLSLSAIMLASCDNNPMLKPLMMKDLGKYLAGLSSTKNTVTCVKYGMDPDEFESKKSFCSKWMLSQYEEYAALTKFEMSMMNASGKTVNDDGEKYDKVIPTYEEFIDPEVWEIVWKQHGKKWTKYLNEQNKREKNENQ